MNYNSIKDMTYLRVSCLETFPFSNYKIGNKSKDKNSIVKDNYTIASDMNNT